MFRNANVTFFLKSSYVLRTTGKCNSHAQVFAFGNLEREPSFSGWLMKIQLLRQTQRGKFFTTTDKEKNV